MPNEAMADLARNKQEEFESRREEMKQRKTAEDAVKAMRTRISFLLEQLEQVSKKYLFILISLHVLVQIYTI
jgi:predicted AlkP superfamily pyrophosphatase or phosphodiesterase